MAVTLAQAQVNTQDDVDFAVIDNLRRYSWLLDQLSFDDTVTPGTGGGSLVYGYTRLTAARSAAFRPFNEEYNNVQAATRDRKTVELHPLGGEFEIDRVLANLGQSATNEVTFQMQQLLIGVRSRFQQEMILGDVAVDAAGFDGLSKALAGTETENTDGQDWSSVIDTAEAAHSALDLLDEWLAEITPSQTGGGTGQPDDVPAGTNAILGNTTSITRVRSIARRAGMYTAEKDDLGRHVERYGDWVLVNIGDRALGNGPIIPITDGVTDLYAVTFGIDSFHAASVAGNQLLRSWMPDYSTAGALKKGEVEMGPAAAVLKNTKAAGVLRDVRVKAAADTGA